MQLTASMFSDPSLRPQLQQYYENKKAAVIESIRAQEGQRPTGDIKFTTPDGVTHTGTIISFTADKAEKAFVSFDKWMEIQEQIYTSNERQLEMAQKNLDRLEKENPDSSSHVRTTFSSDGVLLAYINADGSLAMSNGSDRYLRSISEKADELGLSGQRRVDYLSREINNTLSRHYADLDMTTYNDLDIPTKREFADMWYTNFDIDQHYKDAMAEARASYDSAKEWYDQWQANLKDMQAFLLDLQEAA